MNANDNQFPAVAPKPHTVTDKKNVKLTNKSAEVNIGQTTSLVHSKGTSPVAHTVPHFSGKGKAKDLGPILSMINRAKNQ